MTDSMKTVLVTGASRGLGFEFCKQYAAEGWQVIATCRNPETATALHGLEVRIIGLDTADSAGAAALAETLGDQPIDLLLNNAGIMGDSSRTALDADLDEWTAAFRINVLGPAIVTRALLPNLKRAARPIAATMGSQAGIYECMTSANLAVYRSTKAAAHAVTISLAKALEGEGVLYLSLRPGSTATDMVGDRAQYTTEDSVSLMRGVLVRAVPGWAGHFVDRSGMVYPYAGGFIPG